MLQLHGRVSRQWHAEPMVLRVTTNTDAAAASHDKEAFLALSGCTHLPEGFAAYLVVDGTRLAIPDVEYRQLCGVPAAMSYLAAGDIIRLVPTMGYISVLYRRNSRSNFMLLTERCNSNCVMCSQPPKDVDDLHLTEAYLQAIPLMDNQSVELVITGGEPTLLGEILFDVLHACKKHLPNTSAHMLSNGRLFNYLSLAQRLGEISHPDLMIGIPIYSDVAWRHDFVVQAKNAFDQTTRGIMNLERCGVPVEVRVVLHRDTVGRLVPLARFIARNLPFVDHVAFMGLELMGFARTNLEALWIDAVEYQSGLCEAVGILASHHLNVSIYNYQLCTLAKDLWPYARKCISDWKNEYVEECNHCGVREQCGGFFSSSTLRRSAFIRAIQNDGSSASSNFCSIV
jgi:His-Xaa-Ser system radical SAM maturase HxsC